MNTALEIQEEPFLHYRSISGIQHRYLTDWNGTPLNGIYLIESRLDSPLSVNATPLLLTPGVFDPVRGEYGEETISALLKEKRASIIYEVHFRYNGTCGLLDMPAILEDLCLILSTSDPSLKAVGLSGGCMAICAALYELQSQGVQPTLSHALLIGPHLIDYNTIFIRAVRKVINSDDMMAKVTRHAGHPNVPTNAEKGKVWFKDSEFASAIAGISPRKKRPGFPVNIETRYFRFDTLSKNGRNRLHWYFDCPKPKKPIAGIHRGLFRVPETTGIIREFCSQ